MISHAVCQLTFGITFMTGGVAGRMPGPPFLSGEHVELRTIETHDLDFLQEGVNDPSVWRPIGRPSPVNEQQEQEFLEAVVGADDNVTLLIVGEDGPAGTVSLTEREAAFSAAELGYWVHPDHRRQGYAKEAAGLLTDFGIQQRGYHRITARVFEFNNASQGLLESLGFEHEGVHREAGFADGEYQDVHWYSVLHDEWDSDQWNGL